MITVVADSEGASSDATRSAPRAIAVQGETIEIHDPLRLRRAVTEEMQAIADVLTTAPPRSRVRRRSTRECGDWAISYLRVGLLTCAHS